jgi:hypothetical protein
VSEVAYVSKVRIERKVGPLRSHCVIKRGGEVCQLDMRPNGPALYLMM